VNSPSTAIVIASLCVRLLAVLAGSALKASFIFTIVYFGVRLLRDSQPGQRHLLWCGAVFSYLLILLLSLIGPQVLPLRWPAASDPGGPFRVVSTLLLSPRDASAVAVSGAQAASAAPAPIGQPGWAVALALLVSEACWHV
jgi:hypothetical protein